MKLILEIEMDNDAFSRNPRDETATILEQASLLVQEPTEKLSLLDRKLRDHNGNSVGFVRVIE